MSAGKVFKHYIRFCPPVEPSTPVKKLNPELPHNIRVSIKPILLRSERKKGLEGRLELLAEEVTKLIKYERHEYRYYVAEEVQGYTERLIVEAMRYGDCHRPTMELANFWLREKSLIHKLFKVLVPRYVNYNTSFTNLYKLSPDYSLFIRKPYERIQHPKEVGLLELKGNPLPPLIHPKVKKDYWLTNVLLRSAKLDLASKASDQETDAPGATLSVTKEDK